MLFAHLNRILRLGQLRPRGPNGRLLLLTPADGFEIELRNFDPTVICYPAFDLIHLALSLASATTVSDQSGLA